MLARLRTFVLLGLILTLSGCSSLPYYAQAISGQMEIWRAEVPLEQAIDDSQLDQRTRETLKLIVEARDFAYSQLGFPDNGSYRSFANLNREYVVWNVVVAPRYSLEPKQSCFVVVGCFAYRGYFSESHAREFARGEQQVGNDIYVGGVSAYSTTGWFKDPVLSTMLNTSAEQLIETLFHELAHEWLYIKDDTSFNESYAVVVAEYSLKRWQQRRGIGISTIDGWARQQAILAIIAKTRDRLEALYANETDPDLLASGKALTFAELERDYRALKNRWSGYDGFDNWMLEPWNNAKLASVATYQDWVPFMRQLLALEDHDLVRFRARIAALGAQPAESRQACLNGYSDRGRYGARCPQEYRLAGRDAALP